MNRDGMRGLEGGRRGRELQRESGKRWINPSPGGFTDTSRTWRDCMERCEGARKGRSRGPGSDAKRYFFWVVGSCGQRQSERSELSELIRVPALTPDAPAPPQVVKDRFSPVYSVCWKAPAGVGGPPGSVGVGRVTASKGELQFFSLRWVHAESGAAAEVDIRSSVFAVHVRSPEAAAAQRLSGWDPGDWSSGFPPGCYRFAVRVTTTAGSSPFSEFSSSVFLHAGACERDEETRGVVTSNSLGRNA
eukprot:Cvel_32452.t1-p1 / transcript=Cvel_32452.t1 / gene=Cvel_32452 / organism=Chromera_velia_CCMP2878 / gene_product=hypothetical protein / transcript_product=hypothetical protein / location=Cvel_scaffold5055:3680-6564(+) / protein_length=246 / sequence_SO=supercontig / SO=protein_coding / is_pseudo=false